MGARTIRGTRTGQEYNVIARLMVAALILLTLILVTGFPNLLG